MVFCRRFDTFELFLISLNKITVKQLFLFILLLSSALAYAQTGTITGLVSDYAGKPVADVYVSLENSAFNAISDNEGRFLIKNVPAGRYSIQFSAVGYESQTRQVEVRPNETMTVNLSIAEKIFVLHEIEIPGIRSITGMGYLDEVHGAALFSGKKTEVLLLDSLDANTAQNNPRQVLGRVPGANYSETDGNGFPSNGIGFRGLNPSQSIETNTRQNGYNITGDLYGYPESYYLPPLEAVERIEVIRGASSLQYGAQFGGVINYIISKGNAQKPFELTTQQTYGSFGMFNTFNSVGGQLGKFNYYAFGQFQRIDGWRPNSDFKKFSGFARLEYDASDKIKLGLEYTILRNRIHMAGGLTDSAFAADSRASTRTRNWLTSPWNILTATMDYTISPSSVLTVKSSFNASGRALVWRNEDGGPQAVDSIDPATGEYVNREVENEEFMSNTTEVRWLNRYDLGGRQHSLVSGIRVFTGKFKQQGGGEGTTASDFDLTLLEPEYEKDFDFTTHNIAPFVENTFHIGKSLSLTPGLRYEYIVSTIDGYKPNETENGLIYSDASRTRDILLMGLGLQVKTSSSTNIYANWSQAYRPIEYSNLTPLGTIASVDPSLKDSKGYNADLGFRGSVRNYLTFDIGGFFLRYNDRIGVIETADGPYRTNVADSEHKGLESYIEFSLAKAIAPSGRVDFSFFNSLALVDAKYLDGDYAGNFVEYAPRVIDRLGATAGLHGFSTTFLVSYTGKSYGDAGNSESGSEDAVGGPIPPYTVIDWSATYRYKDYNLKFGVNNLDDRRYFTKRTDEYPGPGIIPSAGRGFYVGVGAKF